jgi:tetratricopeptide (TPR) repeat protein
MKNTFFELLILGFLFCGSANAQHSNELAQADSLIQNHKYESALIVVDNAILQKPGRFVLSEAYFQLAQAYLGLGNLEKANSSNRQSLSIRKKLRYEFIADNYLLFGLIEMQKGDDDKALAYFFKAAELPYESIEFSGLLYAYIAQIYYRKGEIGKVLRYYKIAMETWLTAFEEANILDLNHYQIRKNRLYYDHFFVGYL